ncbi:MAG: preprotein translocase subunit SecG [Caulobacter sp.]|nr:preprotein translocase subunit SecG [Caulobacter sp.]
MQTATIILLCINILVCLLLIGVVLIQKSEGGALGMGGGPSNFMSARGTGDLLTRITWILFTIFLGISIALTLMSAAANKPAIGGGLSIDPAAAARPANQPSGTPANPDATPPGLGVPQNTAPTTGPSLIPQAAPNPLSAPAPEKK